MTKGKEKENAQIKRKKQGREGKIQKRVKRCKRKGKVLSMKIRNKREEEGENRRGYACIYCHIMIY